MRALLLTFLVGCSTWGKAAALAIVADTASTTYMSDDGEWDRRVREGNPVLGQVPSETQLISYTIVALACVGILDAGLPKSWRPWILGPIAAGETFITGRNLWLSRLPEAPNETTGKPAPTE